MNGLGGLDSGKKPEKKGPPPSADAWPETAGASGNRQERNDGPNEDKTSPEDVAGLPNQGITINQGGLATGRPLSAAPMPWLRGKLEARKRQEAEERAADDRARVEGRIRKGSYHPRLTAAASLEVQEAALAEINPMWGRGLPPPNKMIDAIVERHLRNKLARG